MLTLDEVFQLREKTISALFAKRFMKGNSFEKAYVDARLEYNKIRKKVNILESYQMVVGLG